MIQLFLMLQLSYANVVGVDTQNFNPTTDGLDFVTVQSSETLKPGLLNLGFFLNYAVNTLPNYVTDGDAQRTSKEDALLSSDINFGIGIMRGWDVGLSLPAVLSQENNSDQLKGGFVSNGLVDIRANSKIRLSGDDSSGMGLVFSFNLPQIKNNPFEGNKSSPIYNFEFVADRKFGKFATAVNLGYRVRDPGSQLTGVPVVPVDDQYLLSLAASYLFASIDTKLISEIYTSFPATDQKSVTDREVATAEWLMGLKHDVNNQVAVHSGLATEMDHGTSSPDWRVYLGLNWNMGPLWAQKVKKRKKRRRKTQKIAKTLSEPVFSEVPDDPFPESPVSQHEIYVLQINYRLDSDRIPRLYKEYLIRLADYLAKDPPFERLVIHGHTDSVGSEDYNFDLSRRRAQNVLNVLAKLGVDRSRMEILGHGELEPVADNGNFQGRAANRRVGFEIFR